MIVGNPIIMILKAILNWFRLRRDYIANAVDKIPPEIKDALVAWYSPYKQKLTNYDVIEAYTEDFTTWTVNKEGVIANVTSKSITITNVLNLNPLIYDYDTFSVRLRIDGLKNGQGIFFGDNKEYTISENGIYDIDTTENIRTNFIGECNITITQLPTSILKDFSGNKHDAYLYGFKGKLNSGVGIYAQDFKNWSYGSTINKDISTKSYNKFHIVKKKADNWFGFTIGIQKANYYNKPYKLKFNFNKKIDDIIFSVVSTDGNLISTQCFSAIINNGSVVDVPIISEEIFNNQKEHAIYYDFGTNKDIEIDVELIPDYPNQLCYDGKSYAVAYGLPILTDYTVIADRTWFIDKEERVFISKTTGQNGAFIFEYKTPANNKTYSYYQQNDIVIDNNNKVVYQTKNSYNGSPIQAGNKQDTDVLYIGNIRVPDSRSFIGCHGDILLFNRTLTDDELDLVKEHFFGIVRIKDALLTVDGKPIITTDNKYIKVNKK
ncbi:hypothetical protein KNV34_gp52 [uncultured phage cr11_1]|uniref:Uncharacterized protein n=1 Tax=uncultured phage cr11_1 TaxID=2772067 RepID=A0A7M1RWI8_9CAUD|nr:hypothetical protein KNV34_gp52 [uncultured phage cr11_1]QOR58797.1 hypothetical protein [uncultured phage cr11_1]